MTAPAPRLTVGQMAPEFRLRGSSGQFVSLSDHRGKESVVIVFFPLAFTPICAHQLPQLEKARPRLEELRARAIGISVDSWQTNEVFARQIGVRYPLLSDFRRETCRDYGVFDEERFTSARAVFVVDRDGRIAHVEIAGDPDDATKVPAIDRLLAVLERLNR